MDPLWEAQQPPSSSTSLAATSSILQYPLSALCRSMYFHIARALTGPRSNANRCSTDGATGRWRRCVDCGLIANEVNKCMLDLLEFVVCGHQADDLDVDLTNGTRRSNASYRLVGVCTHWCYHPCTSSYWIILIFCRVAADTEETQAAYATHANGGSRHRSQQGERDNNPLGIQQLFSRRSITGWSNGLAASIGRYHTALISSRGQRFDASPHASDVIELANALEHNSAVRCLELSIFSGDANTTGMKLAEALMSSRSAVTCR